MKILVCFMFIILLVNCSSNKNTCNEKIVLQIGKLQFTDYEVEKNINLFKGTILKKTGRQPNENELKQWEQEFLNRAYILAEAYHKGYDTTFVINKKVSAMARFIVSQPEGLLEQKLIDDSINITDEEINTSKLRNSNAQRTQIINALKSQKREKILLQHKMEAMTKAQIDYNEPLIADISKIIASLGDLHEFDKAKFAPLLTQIILKYTINNQRVNVLFNDFIAYYNELPMRYQIGNANQLKINLNTMVLQEVYFRRAEELGITTQCKFLLDKENFKKNTIYSEYENNELKKHITASDKEIETNYELNKPRFVQATNTIVTIYVLDTREKAFKVFGLIRRGISDTSRLFSEIEFRNIQKHVNISFNSKNYPDTLVKSITNLKIKEVTMPIQLNGNFYVAYKENEFGSRTRELNEAKTIITKEIENQKLIRAKDALVLKLKTRYSIKNNIDIKKYTVGQHE